MNWLRQHYITIEDCRKFQTIFQIGRFNLLSTCTVFTQLFRFCSYHYRSPYLFVNIKWYPARTPLILWLRKRSGMQKFFNLHILVVILPFKLMISYFMKLNFCFPYQGHRCSIIISPNLGSAYRFVYLFCCKLRLFQ